MLKDKQKIEEKYILDFVKIYHFNLSCEIDVWVSPKSWHAFFTHCVSWLVGFFEHADTLSSARLWLKYLTSILLLIISSRWLTFACSWLSCPLKSLILYFYVIDTSWLTLVCAEIMCMQADSSPHPSLLMFRRQLISISTHPLSRKHMLGVNLGELARYHWAIIKDLCLAVHGLNSFQIFYIYLEILIYVITQVVSIFHIQPCDLLPIFCL